MPDQLRCYAVADDAEGTLEKVLHQHWLSSSLAARAAFASAGLQALLQLWGHPEQAPHVLRLKTRLAAVILDQVLIFLQLYRAAVHQPNRAWVCPLMKDSCTKVVLLVC